MMKTPSLVAGLLFTPGLQAAENSASLGMSQVAQVFVALLVVLGMIVGLALIFRKANFIPAQNRKLIHVLGSVALGSNEKLVLVQVGEDQVLLSQGRGSVQKIHKLSVNVEVDSKQGQTTPGNFPVTFPQLFNKLLDQKKSGTGTENG